MRWVCVGIRALRSLNGKNGYNVKDSRAAHLLFWHGPIFRSIKTTQIPHINRSKNLFEVSFLLCFCRLVCGVGCSLPCTISMANIYSTLMKMWRLFMPFKGFWEREKCYGEVLLMKCCSWLVRRKFANHSVDLAWNCEQNNRVIEAKLKETSIKNLHPVFWSLKTGLEKLRWRIICVI